MDSKGEQAQSGGVEPRTDDARFKDLQEKLLPQQDRESIRIGLGVLTKYLSSLDTLPKVMIFPETTARPLFYAVKPAINELYASRGINPPAFSFFKLVSTIPLYADRDAQNLIDEANRDDDERWYEDETEAEKLDRKQEEALSVKKAEQIIIEAETSRLMMQKRAEEIVRKAQIEAGDSVMIIDDFSSHEETTITEIRKAFKDAQAKKGAEIDVHAFAFLATENKLDQDHPLTHVLIGRLDPNRDPEHTRWAISAGLSYQLRNKESIGNKKNYNGLYSFLPPDADRESMSALRSALRQVGEDFVKDKGLDKKDRNNQSNLDEEKLLQLSRKEIYAGTLIETPENKDQIHKIG